MLTLSINHLKVMKSEFREAYLNLFDNGLTRLRRNMSVKIRAIRYLKQYRQEKTLGTLNDYGINTAKTTEKVDILPLSQQDID